jgi:hypothetical protein
MNRQNVTLALPQALLKKAKVVAAKKETSLSELLREALEEKVREDSDFVHARTRQLKLLKTGLNLGTGGKLSFSREELHERGQNIS